jgi:hypothetical protein
VNKILLYKFIFLKEVEKIGTFKMSLLYAIFTLVEFYKIYYENERIHFEISVQQIK